MKPFLLISSIIFLGAGIHAYFLSTGKAGTELVTTFCLEHYNTDSITFQKCLVLANKAIIDVNTFSLIVIIICTCSVIFSIIPSEKTNVIVERRTAV